MGHPDWSKIPFEKMPEWKREEILVKSRKKVELLEKKFEEEKREDLKSNLTCDVCGKEAKSLAGLSAHKRSHK